METRLNCSSITCLISYIFTCKTHTQNDIGHKVKKGFLIFFMSVAEREKSTQARSEKSVTVLEAGHVITQAVGGVVAAGG